MSGRSGSDRSIVEIRPARPSEAEPLSRSLVEAFARDPLIDFLFDRGAPGHATTQVQEFFRLLLEVRMALGMPCLAASVQGAPVGAAMGYDRSRPAWPEAFATRWGRLLESLPGLEARLDRYAALGDGLAPTRPHWYLGVIGVADTVRGTGVGKRLLQAFCRASASDPASAGVYLETSSPASLEFYLRHGFIVTGEGRLDDCPLWGVFWPDQPVD